MDEEADKCMRHARRDVEPGYEAVQPTNWEEATEDLGDIRSVNRAWKWRVKQGVICLTNP